jgi:acyl-CoA synthetase (AMP-forming)/AMP-acid ligase II
MSNFDTVLASAPGGNLALIDHDGSRVDYARLRAAVDDACRAMTAHGVRPGDRVAVVAENGVSLAVAVLAVLRLKAWILPVNARVAAPELAAILAHATPRLCLFTSDTSAEAATHAASQGAGSTLAIAGKDLPCLINPTARAEPVSPDSAERVAALVYTSGSTGVPKGVMLSLASLMFNATTAARSRHFAAGDVITLALPCTHIMALTTAFLAAMSAGAAVRMIPRFTVEAIFEALAQGDSVMTGVPLMYEQILRRLETENRALLAPRLRLIGAGGAPLDPALKARTEAAFGLPLQNGYGLTEAGPTVSSTVFGPYRNDGSIGYVSPQSDLRLDAIGPDGIGELLFRGPGVMVGYYRNEGATQAAFSEDGFLRTGDLARLDPDGSIHLVGRSKELIVRSGFNVYPPEVEAALKACRGVLQAAVVGRTVPGNEEVIGFVTTDGTTSTAEIAQALRERLAPYKCPQHIVQVAEMPLTSAGKIRKPDLLAAFTPAIGPAA